LGNFPKFTQMQLNTWRMFRKLQNTQNLKNNKHCIQISKDLTRNLKRQEFRNLSQTNRSKRGSLCIDHVPGVRFEVWGLNISGSRFFNQNPKRNERKREKFLEK